MLKSLLREHIVIESYGIQSYGSYGIQIRPVIRLEVFWMQQIGTNSVDWPSFAVTNYFIIIHPSYLHISMIEDKYLLHNSDTQLSYYQRYRGKDEPEWTKIDIARGRLTETDIPKDRGQIDRKNQRLLSVQRRRMTT
ncbi:hypothetical protein LOAG_14271 [Loa loa]|uniref:Uncharacterized protein n=1 Tax=Loa loa TaxID=7209 RepID=A0A1S0TJD7_LOALO|nr:hypothetical protein LOAG_14271 [Loa loa]EFO14253.1 hypothetical protein LOAG_14271 [Loa loa]